MATAQAIWAQATLTTSICHLAGVGNKSIAPPNNSSQPPPSAFILTSNLLLRLQLHHRDRLTIGGLPQTPLHILQCNLLIVILS